MEISPISSSSQLTNPNKVYRRNYQERDLELARDQLCVLFRTELSYHIQPIPCQISFENRVTTEDWRRKICQWSYRVVDSFRLDRSVVYVAMNILDRFLLNYEFGSGKLPCPCISCKRSFDSRKFQLASVTCLYIAIKASPEVESEEEAERRRNFPVDQFVSFSRGLFSQQDVHAMEKIILQTVGWKVNPPTVTCFVAYLLDLLPPSDTLTFAARRSYNLVHQVLREVARYLSELAVCLGKDLSASRPSHVAFAAITVSMELLSYEALPQNARMHFCHSFLLFDSDFDHNYLENMHSILLATLSPEMLLENDTTYGQDHPIALAQYYGLLDLSKLQRPKSRDLTPPSRPSRNQKQSGVSPSSPVSISSPNC